VVAIYSIVVILSECLGLFGIFVLIQIHLCRTRRNIGVELVVQPMNLLMQVVIVLLCIGQLLL
jgi:hypothetical protein